MQSREEILSLAKFTNQILNMRSKRSKKAPSLKLEVIKRLLNALESIVLIVISVLIAFWVDRARERNDNGKNEKMALVQIKDVALQDMPELLQTGKKYNEQAEKIDSIVKLLEQDSALPDSLNKMIKRLLGFGQFLCNKSAYESMKAQGLAIVSPKLRLSISNLYEIHYEWLWFNEKELTIFYNSILVPHMLKNAPFQEEPYSPSQISTIRKDKELIPTLKLFKKMNQNVSEEYKETFSKLKEVLKVFYSESK